MKIEDSNLGIFTGIDASGGDLNTLNLTNLVVQWVKVKSQARVLKLSSMTKLNL